MTWLDWSALDWILIAVLALSALSGLVRGFIGVVASLAAWLLAAWAALRFGGQVALLLARGGEPGPGQLLAGFGLSFIIVLVLVGLVGWMVRKLVHSVGLSGLDRLLGLVLGLLRGGVIACVLVLLAGLTAIPRGADWQRAQVVPIFIPGALWLRAWLPDWVAQRVELGGAARRPATPDAGPARPEPGLPGRGLPEPPRLPDPARTPSPEPTHPVAPEPT